MADALDPSLPIVSSGDLFPDLEQRPRLLLGLDPDWLTRGGRLRPSRTWHHVRHQSGGIHCYQVELLATELVLPPEREAGLLRLDDLLEADNSSILALGMFNRWRLWIIAENSD